MRDHAAAPTAELNPWRKELGTLLWVAGPIAITQLGYMMMGFVDTVIAGRISPEAQGATGLGSSVFFLIATLGLGVTMGIDPLASQAFGAGQPRLARSVMWQGLYAGGLVALPLALVMLVVSTQFERFGVLPELAVLGRHFLVARTPGIIPILAGVALRTYLQSAHRTGWVLYSTLIANVLNLVFDWLLGFGDAGLVKLGLPAIGLPALGVTGLALSSTLMQLAQLGILAWAVSRLPPGAGDRPLRRFDAPVIRRIIHLGLPIGLTMAAEVGVFAVSQVLIAGMDVISADAHQIALMFASLTFSLCLGLGAATSVEVGRAIGRGDGPATRRAGILGMLIALGFMSCTGVAMALVPETLAHLMGAKPDIVPLAVTLLRIAAVFQLADGLQAVAGGALRGAGLTHWSSVANLIAHWAFGFPIGLLLAYGFDMHAAGLWWGFTAGLAAIGVSLAWKFLDATRTGVARLRHD